MKPCTVLTVLVGPAFIAACSTGELTVNPAPVDTPSAVADAAVDSALAIEDAAPETETLDALSEPHPIPEAGTLRRSVLHRSPFGNLEHAHNLLLDGDFEWSASPDGYSQTPWYGIGEDGQSPIKFETGGLCRSGLRCARIDNSLVLVGSGIGSTQTGTEFWMWAKVPGSSCDVLTILLFPDMTQSNFGTAVVSPETEAPDASGWCRFHGLQQPTKEAIAVYIEPTNLDGSQFVILDDAVLRPIDGLSPMSLHRKPIAPELLERAVKTLSWWKKNRFYGRKESTIPKPSW